jgi:hypothetical protein
MMFLDVSAISRRDTIYLTCSAASDKNYHKFEHLLSPGWVPGRKIVRFKQ